MRDVVAALSAALAAEHAACYGYGIVGSHLTGTRLAEASQDWIAHERARDQLMAALTDLHVQPPAAAPAYRLPVTVTSARTAVTLAITLERQVAAAYLGLVAISEPAVRSYGAAGLRSAAVRAARWSGSSQAFPGL